MSDEFSLLHLSTHFKVEVKVKIVNNSQEPRAN